MLAIQPLLGRQLGHAASPAQPCARLRCEPPASCAVLHMLAVAVQAPLRGSTLLGMYLTAYRCVPVSASMRFRKSKLLDQASCCSGGGMQQHCSDASAVICTCPAHARGRNLISCMSTGQGIHHQGWCGPVPDRDPWGGGRGAAEGRAGVRHHHRPSPQSRLAGHSRPPLCHQVSLSSRFCSQFREALFDRAALRYATRSGLAAHSMMDSRIPLAGPLMSNHVWRGSCT